MNWVKKKSLVANYKIIAESYNFENVDGFKITTFWV